jgi:glycosyltransferase involved in cell wall biosynthesis
MNIVHVVESLDRGGLERMVCDLAQAQRASGEQVSVLCLFHAGTLAAELKSAGIGVGVIGKRSGADLAALWRLRRTLLELAPDVVHTHNAVVNYHCVAATRWSRIGPVINTRHGMGEAAASRVERRYRASLARTACVVAVSQYSGAHLVQQTIVPPTLLRVVPNGIRVERFALQSRAQARARLGVPAEALLVGTVGRLNWAKDQAVLVQAIASLAPRLPQLRCVLVGEGALRAALQRQITALGMEERVTLLGDRGDVPELLPGFDVFALPSRTEGYSIALLETAASGVPAVVSDVGGNREIVQHGVTGLVAGADFAAALARLLEDATLRLRMGIAARDWAAGMASVQGMQRRYAELYGSLQ